MVRLLSLVQVQVEGLGRRHTNKAKFYAKLNA